MHNIVRHAKATLLRARFIDTFLNTSTDRYKRLEASNMTAGYMFDNLYRDSYTIVPFRRAVQEFAGKPRVYSMWDLIPSRMICPGGGIIIPHYLELYQTETVIEWDTEELTALLEKELGDYDATDYLNNTMPEDIYIFDDSLEWCVIFTHEYIREMEGERACFICKRMKPSPKS